MVERRPPISLRPDEIVPYLLTEYGRWVPDVFSGCFNSLSAWDHTYPDRHLILALATAQACLNSATKLDYVRETWQVTAERITPGEPSPHFAMVREFLWSRFIRVTDTLAGGIVASAELACARLKNTQPKANRWDKAHFKIIDDAGLGGNGKPMPAELVMS